MHHVLIHTGKGWMGGERTREKVRGATVHKLGRKYQHDWMHLQSINSDKNLPKSPFTGHFFRWRLFAVVSILLISPCFVSYFELLSRPDVVKFIHVSDVQHLSDATPNYTPQKKDKTHETYKSVQKNSLRSGFTFIYRKKKIQTRSIREKNVWRNVFHCFRLYSTYTNKQYLRIIKIHIEL